MQFNFKLLSVAHDWICNNSSAHVLVFVAETTREVSSANFNILLVSCIGRSSYAAGPIAEPWTMLAKISATSDMLPANFMQCKCPWKSLLSNYRLDPVSEVAPSSPST